MELDSRVYGLKDKVAIVTGGGAGIGKGIVTELARAGASVAVVDIDNMTAERTVNEVRALGGKATKIIADVQESEQVDRIVRQTLNEFGTIDILVNNVGGLAGIVHQIPFWEMSEELWDKVIRLNTKPLYLWSKAVALFMIENKKGGSMINISSMVGMVPPSTLCAAYGLAKAGIINFTVTAAADLGKYGIRVNAIAPGRITTPMTDKLYEDHPEVRIPQIRIIPLGRIGTPEDIGQVAVFLASDAAGYISGHTVLVSGGLTHLYTPR